MISAKAAVCFCRGIVSLLFQIHIRYRGNEGRRRRGVPREEHPCVLADLRDEGVDQGASLRFRVNGGEVRGAEHAADDPRRLAGVHKVVDYQPFLVDSHEIRAFQYIGGCLVAHRVARDADGVYEADVQLSRDDRSRHQPAARHRYQTAPVAADVEQLPGQGAAVSLHLFP